MTKEIHEINKRATDFVDELIYYIFHVQDADDDNLSAELVCRKLLKHGLIDKVDGYYQTHEIRTNTHECVKDTHDKTENNSEKPNNCEDFFREPTAEERKAVADYIDSISVPTGVNVFDFMDEPTISKMEQVEDKPKTQMKTQNSNLTFEKRTMRDCYNCKRYETEGECIECKFEPKDEPQTDLAQALAEGKESILSLATKGKMAKRTERSE